MEDVIIEMLDKAIAQASNNGQPAKLVVTQEAYNATLKAIGQGDLLDDPDAILPQEYKGIPLEVRELTGNYIIEIVSIDGRVTPHVE